MLEEVLVNSIQKLTACPPPLVAYVHILLCKVDNVHS